MESMKNIKPAYAVKLGKGVFAGAWYTFRCSYCFKVVENNCLPRADYGASCNGAEDGKHKWELVGEE